MYTSRPVSDLDKCWCLVFVVQCTRHGCMSSWPYHVLRFNSVVSLTQYCADGKIEKNEMGGTCGAYGGGERYAQGVGGET
jgi:hypothetical protein